MDLFTIIWQDIGTHEVPATSVGKRRFYGGGGFMRASAMRKNFKISIQLGMTDRMVSSPRLCGLWRVFSVLAGLVLTADAVWLMGMRLFHFGIVLPLV